MTEAEASRGTECGVAGPAPELQAAPEPSTITLVGAAGLVLVLRWRRMAVLRRGMRQ